MTQTPTSSESPHIGGRYSAKIVKFQDYRKPERTFEKEAATKEELFRAFYEMNRHLRYCNGEYYKFEDKAVQEEYDKWYKSLSESERFDMYYGDGIVD